MVYIHFFISLFQKKNYYPVSELIERWILNKLSQTWTVTMLTYSVFTLPQASSLFKVVEQWLDEHKNLEQLCHNYIKSSGHFTFCSSIDSEHIALQYAYKYKAKMWPCSCISSHWKSSPHFASRTTNSYSLLCRMGNGRFDQSTKHISWTYWLFQISVYWYQCWGYKLICPCSKDYFILSYSKSVTAWLI